MYTPGYIKREKQYTGGGVYMYDGKDYIGYYNITQQGPYTGKTFTKASHRIHPIEYVENDQSGIYAGLADAQGITTDLEFDDPVPTEVAPTQDDYKLGHFNRYFIQQRNDRHSRIREVDKDQYDALASNTTGLNPNYYKGMMLRWKIKGPKNDIMRGTKLIKAGVEDTNRRTIEEKEFRMSGITATLQYRLFEFSKGAPTQRDTNTDIKL